MVLVAVAVFCREIRYSYDNNLIDAFLNFIRISIYIGMISMWGVSVGNRVIQHQVRRLLIAVSVLMVLWLTVREFKFHFVLDPTLLRYLWYSYYIPMLSIPMLAVFISMSLGKPEQFRIPGLTWLMCIPTVLLIGLVLTNEYHQMVFLFPDGQVRTEFNCTYGAGYFAVLGWALFCSLLSIIIMIYKSRKPQNRKTAWLPMIPFGVALLYILLYIMRVSFVVDVLGDTAVFYCLVITAVFECCVWCGLIQSNSGYSDLFRASLDISAQITDDDYNVRYCASNAKNIDKEDMINAATKPVIIEGGKRLHNMRVNGGHVIWMDDISELLELREKLKDSSQELTDRNELLQYEYEREKEYKAMEEQNRLYDLLQNKTQKQLDKIDALVRNYETLSKAGVEREKINELQNKDNRTCVERSDNREQRIILAHIVILGTFVKRRKDFVLSANDNEMLDNEMLSRAFSESFRALGLLNVRGSFLVDMDSERSKADVLTLIYDFFEDIVEQTMDKLQYINVRMTGKENLTRVNIMIDCHTDNRTFVDKYAENSKVESEIIEDEDGTEFLLSIEGGGDV